MKQDLNLTYFSPLVITIIINCTIQSFQLKYNNHHSIGSTFFFPIFQGSGDVFMLFVLSVLCHERTMGFASELSNTSSQRARQVCTIHAEIVMQF